MSSKNLLKDFFVAALCLGAVSTWAGGVVRTSTEAALRLALSGGGTVTFTNNANISIASQIVISQAPTIIDALGHTVTITSSNGVALFKANTNLTLRGLGLINGTSSSAGGALYVQSGAVVVANGCLFSGNTVTATNGLAGSNGTTNSNNSGGDGGAGIQGPSARGGAIYNLGSLALVNCALNSNQAKGGAGGAGGSGGPGSGTFSIAGNGGQGANGGAGLGGAIYNGGNLTLINCTFRANTVTGGDGGQGGAAGAGNFAGVPGDGGTGGAGSGGAVFNAANLTVWNSTWVTNSATGGASADGGLSSNGTGMKGLKGGQGAGGGIFNNWWMAMTNCTFYSNRVTGGAGGNGGDGGGTFEVPGDGGDGGDGLGGGFANANTITIVNCTFSSSGAFGGTNGVAGTGNFSANDGSPGSANGGNIANIGPIFSLANSILTASVSGPNAFGTFTDDGFNLSSDTVDSLGSSSIQNRDPKLGALAANGGTTMTMALLTGSPAIDRIPADAAPATDQRGFARPFNDASDIGAFEFGASVTISNAMLSIQSASNGVRLTGGVSGTTYVVQASTNLINWQAISTNTAPISFSDPVTNARLRFYRIKR